MASDHEVPEEPKPKKMATDIEATATRLLGVSAATKVANPIIARPITVSSLRLPIAVKPRLVSRSASQPTRMLPTKPNRNGTEATKPVFGMLIWRWISR